jgi:hypothetical protein
MSRLYLALLVSCGTLLAPPATGVPVQWTGSADGTSWNVAANWNPAVVPNNGASTYEVGIGGTAAVVLDGGFRINSLSLGSGASLRLGEADFLGFNADSINDGTIRLQDGSLGGTCVLRFEGVARLGGSGQVLFDSGFANGIGPSADPGQPAVRRERRRALQRQRHRPGQLQDLRPAGLLQPLPAARALTPPVGHRAPAPCDSLPRAYRRHADCTGSVGSPFREERR